MKKEDQSSLLDRIVEDQKQEHHQQLEYTQRVFNNLSSGAKREQFFVLNDVKTPSLIQKQNEECWSTLSQSTMSQSTFHLTRRQHKKVDLVAYYQQFLDCECQREIKDKLISIRNEVKVQNWDQHAQI